MLLVGALLSASGRKFVHFCQGELNVGIVFYCTRICENDLSKAEYVLHDTVLATLQSRAGALELVVPELAPDISVFVRDRRVHTVASQEHNSTNCRASPYPPHNL